jgi:dsDNA-binding SOS-regulon protein
MKKSDERKKALEKAQKEEELEEEEVQQLDEENQEEDSLFVALGDLMGVLFKTHRELTLGIVNELYNSVLSHAL